MERKILTARIKSSFYVGICKIKIAIFRYKKCICVQFKSDRCSSWAKLKTGREWREERVIDKGS